MDIQLSEHDLLPEDEHCPVCHSSSARAPLFTIYENPQVWLLECPSCYAASASRMPSPEFLRRYYINYFEDKDIKVSIFEFDRFYRHLCGLAGLHRAQSANFRIVDIGGGDGSLAIHIAERLLERGQISTAEVCIIDIHPLASSKDGRVSISRMEHIKDRTGTYDLIIASAVLEHIPDLHSLMPLIFDALSAGGYFYARTPYAVPMRKLFKSYDILYPMHVHDLGSKFWNNCIERLGLKKVRAYKSQPSIIRTSLRAAPLLTIITALLKLPAHLQVRLFPSPRIPLLWKWVGGWEVCFYKPKAGDIAADL